jgi:hypothetical protein
MLFGFVFVCLQKTPSSKPRTSSVAKSEVVPSESEPEELDDLP